MKIISNKKYEEWKKMEKDYCVEITKSEMLQTQLTEILKEEEQQEKIRNKTYSEFEQTIQRLNDTNRELADKLEIIKKEKANIKRQMTTLKKEFNVESNSKKVAKTSKKVAKTKGEK